VNTYRVNQGDAPFDILAEIQPTVRDDRFKLLQLEEPNCDAGGLTQRYELYELTSSPPSCFARRYAKRTGIPTAI
jgi:hypothetical protein